MASEEQAEVQDIGFGIPEIGQITVKRIQVDPTVQRRLDMNRVNTMIANLTLEAIGVLTVNERESGGIFAVDGQHRREALIRSGHEEHVVTIHKYTHLSIPAEAKLFELLNTTKPPGPLDMFKARLLSGDPATREMYRMLTEREWRIVLEVGDHRFAAVKTLEALYRLSPEVTEKTVDALTKAWGGKDSSLDHRILNGLGHLLIRYDSIIDYERLIRKLGNYSGGPEALISAARALQVSLRNRSKDAMAFTIVQAYNSGARENQQIPQWGAPI